MRHPLTSYATYSHHPSWSCSDLVRRLQGGRHHRSRGSHQALQLPLQPGRHCHPRAGPDPQQHLPERAMPSRPHGSMLRIPQQRHCHGAYGCQRKHDSIRIICYAFFNHHRRPRNVHRRRFVSTGWCWCNGWSCCPGYGLVGLPSYRVVLLGSIHLFQVTASRGHIDVM